MYGVLMIFGEPTPEELAAREARILQQASRTLTIPTAAPAATAGDSVDPAVTEAPDTVELASIAIPIQSPAQSPALVSASTDATAPAAPARVETLTIAPAPEPAAPEAIQQASIATTNDIWRVTARAVNLRAGPSTNNTIVGRAIQNESAEIIQMLPSGWAKVYILETGTEAFMSARFLAAPE